MNIRKPIDYSAMYRTLDRLIVAGLPQAELYFEIGRAVCSRQEKGGKGKVQGLLRQVLLQRRLRGQCLQFQRIHQWNL